MPIDEPTRAFDVERESRLDQLLAEYVEAEERGQSPDRTGLLAANPDLADELREFFANRDQMEQAMGAVRPPSPPRNVLPKLRYFGDYELLEEIARGGMGIVYKARQVSLNRTVAVKMIRAGEFASPSEVERFHSEAKAAANLDHPGIVPIYEVGEQQGQHYFSMGYVDGPSLATRLAEGPLPPREAAELLIEVGQAVHYAHQRGVIHRDLKPGNILITRSADSGIRGAAETTDSLRTPPSTLRTAIRSPKITDFGLAKRVSGDSSLTQTGQILGTPSFMPPEQASAKLDMVGVASDVYALGAILYNALAGRPPFQAANAVETLKQVVESDPVPPRQLNSEIPRDLETIALKCLEKTPVRRYTTAEDLCDELRRYLNDRPILARPVGRAERVWRWCHRNPLVAATSGLAAMLLLVVATVSTLAYFREASLRDDLQQKERTTHMALVAETTARQAETSARIAESAARDEEKRQREAAVAQTELANSRLYRSLVSEARALQLSHREGWREAALQNITQAAALEVPDRDLHVLRGEAATCLAEFDVRLVATMPDSGGRIWSLAYSPDGSRLAAAGSNGKLWLWRVEEDKLISDRVIDDPGAAIKKEYYPDAPMPSVRFHPSGDYLAFASWSRSVQFVALREGVSLPSTVTSPAQPRSIAFDLLGKTLAITWIDGQAELRDAASGERQRSLPVAGANQGFQWMPVALSPDGALLATVGVNNSVQLHLVADEGSPRVLGRHRDGIRTLAFSPDGSYLLSASMDKTARIWNTKTGTEQLTLLGHTARVNGAAFSPDGELIATTGDDGTVRVWETQSGQTVMVLRPPGGVGRSVAFSPDGRQLAVANGPVHIYRLVDRRLRRRLIGHTYNVNGITFPAGQATLVTCSSDKSIIVWDTTLGRALLNFRGHPNKGVHHLKSSPDGKWLAAANISFFNFVSNDHLVRVFDIATGSARHEFRGQRTDVVSVAFDPASRLLASCGADGVVIVWDLTSGQEAHRWTTPNAKGRQLEFVSQGEQLLLIDNAGELQLCRLNDGAPAGAAKIAGGIQCTALISAGHELYLGGAKGAVRKVSLPGLETQTMIEKAHDGAVSAVGISDDGGWLATCGSDRRVVLWDVQTSEKVLIFPPHNGAVTNLAFDDTCTFLAASGMEEHVTLWDLTFLRAGLASHQLDWSGEFAVADNSRSAANRDALQDAARPPQTSRSLSPGHSVALPSDVIPLTTAAPAALRWSAALGSSTRKHTAAYSSDGRWLATRAATGIKIWAADDGTEQFSLPVDAAHDDYDFAFASGGRLLACAARDGVHLFDLDLKARVRLLPVDETTPGFFCRVVFSPDGKWLVAGHLKGANVWSTGDWKLVHRLKSKTGWIAGVAFNQECTLLATAGQDSQVRIWQMPAGDLLHEHAGSSPAYSVAFSPDGTKLAAAFAQRDREQLLNWDTVSGLQVLTAVGHQGFAHSIAYRADGQIIVTAGSDGTIAFWEAASWRVLGKIQADAASAYFAAFSPDGRSLATVGAERTLRIWDAEKLVTLATEWNQ